MKYRVISVVIVLLLVLTGCNSNVSDPKLNLNSISFTADISYYNENYIADCIINDDHDFSAKIILPENLTGLMITYNESTCNIEYNGMRIDNA